MPTNQPSNAPDSIGEDAGEDLTIGAVMADEDLDDAPGGGGLGGAAAARGGAEPGSGTAPNAPIDVPTPRNDAADAIHPDAAREASEANATTEPPPESL